MWVTVQLYSLTLTHRRISTGNHRMVDLWFPSVAFVYLRLLGWLVDVIEVLALQDLFAL